MPQESTTDAFACTLCGCVCDDLRITVKDGRICEARGACSLAEPWLLSQGTISAPPAQVDGLAVPLEQAVDRAVQILRAARAPLIFGLAECGTDGQRAAVALADRLGAAIDAPASSLPLTLAVQEAGMSTCSLGEVRNRADLIVLWGADPLVNQPRLLERIVLVPAPDPLHSDKIAMDRSRRTLVVVDGRRTASAEIADRFMPIQDGRHFETIWALRGLLREPPLPGAEHAAAGMAHADLSELAGRMKECRMGVVFFGQGLNAEGPRSVEALLRLATELNERKRFYALGLRNGGAENVLAWQTGFPSCVNLARGYPRSNPGEFSAGRLLENAEVDACLLLGSDALGELSTAALANLRRLPTISLDAPGVSSLDAGSVRITTAIPGIHIPGTAYRLDGVAIPLRAVLPESYPRPAAVLQSICARL